MVINTSLATFLKIAVTAIIIGALIFGSMYALVGSISNDVANYVS
jgi:hypothetical protein